jgi:hypothetical protein
MRPISAPTGRRFSVACIFFGVRIGNGRPFFSEYNEIDCRRANCRLATGEPPREYELHLQKRLSTSATNRRPGWQIPFRSESGLLSRIFTLFDAPDRAIEFHVVLYNQQVVSDATKNLRRRDAVRLQFEASPWPKPRASCTAVGLLYSCLHRRSAAKWQITGNSLINCE